MSLQTLARQGVLRKVLGVLAFLLFWHLASTELKLPRFETVPGPNDRVVAVRNVDGLERLRRGMTAT